MKKKKYIVHVIMILILFATSIGTYMCYPMIQEAINKDNQDANTITSYVVDLISEYNYPIDYQLKTQKNKDFNTSEYLQIIGKDNTQDVMDAKENFQYQIKQSIRQLEKQTDLYYQAVDNESQIHSANTNDDLSSIMSNKELQEKYQWYIQIQFDKDGSLFVNFTKDGIEIPYEKRLNYQSHSGNEENFYSDDNEIISTIKYNNPKNLTITYAVPKTLQSGSQLSLYINNPGNTDYFRFSLPYLLTCLFIVMCMIFIIPMHYLNENKFLQFISRIKFIILAFIWCTVTSTLYIISPYLVIATTQNLMGEFFSRFGIQNLSDILTPIFNIGLWFIFYLMFMILAYMIKYLYCKGFKRYFMENTCTGWLIKNSKKIIDKVIDFDLSDEVNKSVLKIVLFNFIIITGISIFFVFGIFFACIYSVIIFVILQKKFNQIKEQYQVLLNATQQLSNGNFNVEINEDVGIFNPLKDEFSHIRDGFEKAVQEEVKSQKTKTELISNVSHDLKTPLTSIITYVDLLKNPHLTDDDHEHYLQILERNSLRLKNLIEDLFEVSKANSGDIRLDYVDVDIVALIKQAQLECEDKLSEKNLDLRTTFTEEKMICHLDSSKTYRIFENLFINISKYALEHTRVYIDVIENDDSVTIIFKNISAEEMRFNENEIVERFVQGDQSRNTSGSGLGLAIVKSFTELQGGRFTVELDGDLFKSIITFYK